MLADDTRFLVLQDQIETLPPTLRDSIKNLVDKSFSKGSFDNMELSCKAAKPCWLALAVDGDDLRGFCCLTKQDHKIYLSTLCTGGEKTGYCRKLIEFVTGFFAPFGLPVELQVDMLTPGAQAALRCYEDFWDLQWDVTDTIVGMKLRKTEKNRTL